jgi:hypothetical protein
MPYLDEFLPSHTDKDSNDSTDIKPPTYQDLQEHSPGHGPTTSHRSIYLREEDIDIVMSAYGSLLPLFDAEIPPTLVPTANTGDVLEIHTVESEKKRLGEMKTNENMTSPTERSPDNDSLNQSGANEDDIQQHDDIDPNCTQNPPIVENIDLPSNTSEIDSIVSNSSGQENPNRYHNSDQTSENPPVQPKYGGNHNYSFFTSTSDNK